MTGLISMFKWVKKMFHALSSIVSVCSGICFDVLMFQYVVGTEPSACNIVQYQIGTISGTNQNYL